MNDQATPVLDAPAAPAAKPKAPKKAAAKKAPAKPKAKAAPSHNGATRDKRLPNPGATIKREYKGKEYKVKVKTDSFEYGGKEFGSLTAVAKAIRKSDQEVNGFAFFGLA